MERHMSDTFQDSKFEDTMLYRRFKAQPGVPDKFADSEQATIAFDEVLTLLGVRAPRRGPNESEADHLAKLGEHAAAFGPEERKHINRYNLPSAALAEFVRQDLDIARQEIEHPRYSLKPGELREVVKTDRAGREVKEFYSLSGPSIWMDQFKDPMAKYVSGGSKGIATGPTSDYYNFDKANIVPEYVALQERAAYQDSTEYKLIQAYRDVGKEPPPELLEKIRGK
jgi:hypothetical protein